MRRYCFRTLPIFTLSQNSSIYLFGPLVDVLLPFLLKAISIVIFLFIIPLDGTFYHGEPSVMAANVSNSLYISLIIRYLSRYPWSQHQLSWSGTCSLGNRPGPFCYLLCTQKRPFLINPLITSFSWMHSLVLWL